MSQPSLWFLIGLFFGAALGAAITFILGAQLFGRSARDAARYRWLRRYIGSNWITRDGHTFTFHSDKALFLGTDEGAWDAAIDNAMKQSAIKEKT